MSLPGRSLRVATIVILALTFFGVVTSLFYPIAGFSTQSVDKPIIAVWEPGDEEQAAKQIEEDTPTPTLSSAPARFETSEATETAIDPWTSEVVEAALREPFAQGPQKADEAAKRDDLPRAVFDTPAAPPADPVLPRVESPSSENPITASENPALTPTAQYPDVMAQPLPAQTSSPVSPVDTDTFPQFTAPLDDMTSSPLPADSQPLRENL